MTNSPDEPAGGATALDRADALAVSGSSIVAVARYRELLAAEPGHVEARLRLARLLDRLQERDEAVALLSQGLGRSPDTLEFVFLRGTILSRLRRYDEAESDLRRVLRARPADADAEFELGLVAWRRGLGAQ